MHVTGTDLLKRGKVLMPCRECGSTLRFLIPLAFFSDNEAVFIGSERLMPVSYTHLDVYKRQEQAQSLTGL